MNFWGIVAALLGAIAWIYQQSWDHQKKRVQMYSAIIDLLPYFMTGQLDPDQMNKALTEGRRLWLSAPDNVVLAFDKLLDVAEGISEDSCALGTCVAAMRRNSTYRSALFPPFWKTTLTSENFRVRTAHLVARMLGVSWRWSWGDAVIGFRNHAPPDYLVAEIAGDDLDDREDIPAGQLDIGDEPPNLVGHCAVGCEGVSHVAHRRPVASSAAAAIFPQPSRVGPQLGRQATKPPVNSFAVFHIQLRLRMTSSVLPELRLMTAWGMRAVGSFA